MNTDNRFKRPPNRLKPFKYHWSVFGTASLMKKEWNQSTIRFTQFEYVASNFAESIKCSLWFDCSFHLRSFFVCLYYSHCTLRTHADCSCRFSNTNEKMWYNKTHTRVSNCWQWTSTWTLNMSVVLINAEEMSQFPHQKCSIAPSIENEHVFHLAFVFASDQYVCQ